MINPEAGKPEADSFTLSGNCLKHDFFVQKCRLACLSVDP